MEVKKKKLQFDISQAGDSELDDLQKLSGHVTRVEMIREALNVYNLVLREAFATPNTKIRVVNKNGEIEFLFPSRALRNLF